MKEKLLNNLGLKVVSLVLAFAVWMAIVNISNPIIDDSQVVGVDMRNENVLKSVDLTYEIAGKDTVTVSYQVRTRDRSLIKASDFHAYVDLKDYSVIGSIPVTVEINKEKENLIISDSVIAKPMVIRINTEKLQRKEFELTLKPKGKAAEGYVLGTYTISPNYVTVEGPESQIGSIHHMGVEVDVGNATGDIYEVVPPVFYDSNGNPIPEKVNRVSVNSQEIECHVPVLKSKDLAVHYVVSGEVAKGYRYTGLETSVKTIPVAGTKSDLASLTILTVNSDKLNIGGATSDKVVHLDLSQYLPPGTSVQGDEYENVTVKLKVEPLITRIFTLDLKNVNKTGSETDYDYSFDHDTSEVKIRGLMDDLDALTEKDLNAVLDLSNQGTGVHPGILKFEVSRGFEVVEYTPFHVTVSDKDSVPGTEETTTVSSEENTESQQ